MGRWFKKTTVGKTTYQTCDADTKAWVKQHPVITAVGNDTGTSPAGHSSVSLGSHNSVCACRGLASSFWNGVSAQRKHYWGSTTSTVWHKGGWTGQERGPCSGRTTPQRKPREGTTITEKEKRKERKGLHCKLLKRKNRKSSLAIPCAIFRCPVIRVLSSWVLEPYITTQRLKKKKMPRKKSKLRFRVNWVSWRFRLSSAVSLETTTLGQGPDRMLSYWQWFNENTLLFKHLFCFKHSLFPLTFFHPLEGRFKRRIQNVFMMAGAITVAALCARVIGCFLEFH